MKEISVITVNYNNREGLLKTIKSVVGQSAFEKIEFIVIDGGSDDGSYDVIQGYKGQIDYWVSERDQGVYNAMNKGVAVASCPYCNFMNSGDCFHSETVIEALLSKGIDADIICGNTYTVETGSWHITPPEEISLETLFSWSLNHQSTIIRTHLLKKYGYDESLRIVADRKFFLQALILDNCSYQKVEIDIADYDVTGMSSQNRYESKVEYESVLREMIPERIRIDYGRKRDGVLYGDTDYERFFVEVSKRKYREVIYCMSVIAMRFASLFVKSANFARQYPIKTK